MGPLG
jgi:hypothetical protein